MFDKIQISQGTHFYLLEQLTQRQMENIEMHIAYVYYFVIILSAFKHLSAVPFLTENLS